MRNILTKQEIVEFLRKMAVPHTTMGILEFLQAVDLDTLTDQELREEVQKKLPPVVNLFVFVQNKEKIQALEYANRDSSKVYPNNWNDLIDGLIHFETSHLASPTKVTFGEDLVDGCREHICAFDKSYGTVNWVEYFEKNPRFAGMDAMFQPGKVGFELA